MYYRDKKDFAIISAEEIRPYIENAPDDDYTALIAVVWLTGSRIQEVVNLTPGRVNLNNEEEHITFVIDALKHGKTGYPTFSFSDPYVSSIVIPYILRRKGQSKVFRRGKRMYERTMKKLNEEIHGNNKQKWIVFHQMRHSRITFLARVGRASPEEIKSWTGHRSAGFEDYFAPRKVERFRGKIQ